MSKAARLVVTILPGLSLAALLAIAGAIILDVPKFYSLTKNPHVIDGTVTSKERENHMSVWFEYKVDGQVFRSAGRAGDIGKSFETIQLGEIVPVYYDVSNPAASTLGKPDRYLESSLLGTGFIFIGVMVFFLIFVIKRKMSSDNLKS